MGLVADTLRMARQDAEKGVFLHSDQGSQYTSSVYNDLTK